MPSEACGPSLSSPPNSSEPQGAQGGDRCRFRATLLVMLQGTLSVTLYPQLKKLSGSVAKQPQLMWERIRGPQGRQIQNLY